MLLIRFVVDVIVCRIVITKDELAQHILTLTVKNRVNSNWVSEINRVLLYLINVNMTMIIYNKCMKDTKINYKVTSLIMNMP